MSKLSYCVFTAPYIPENKSDELEGLLKENNLDYMTFYGVCTTIDKEEVKVPIYVVVGSENEDIDVLSICADCCAAVGTNVILVKDIGTHPYYYYIKTIESEPVANYLNLSDSKYIKVCETYFETVAFCPDWVNKIIQFKGITFY